MHVSRLRLHDFRNYCDVDVALGEGVHLIVGANGQGKTNLVEAVGYLGTLRSHRVSSDAALIREGCDAAIINATLASGPRQLAIDVRIARSGANQVRVHGRTIRARELPRYFTSVLFAPEDLHLVRGEPAARRTFLDSLLATRSPRLAAVVADYERTVRQRNAQLRTLRAAGPRVGAENVLAFWDERLVTLGTVIVVERARLASRLRPYLIHAYEAIAGTGHEPDIRLGVTALGEDAPLVADDVPDSDEVAERFTSRLGELQRRELERATSLVGPHRDEVIFSLRGLPARNTASHGESWSFALALRLAAADLIRAESRTGDPVVILDDVFAELDRRRRSRLAAAVKGFEQVLVTAAVLDDIPEALRRDIIGVRHGRIVPLDEALEHDDAAFGLDDAMTQDSEARTETGKEA